MSPLSGFTSNTISHVVYDVGVAYIDTVPFGVTRGGLTVRLEEEWREVEFDGRGSPVEGMDRRMAMVTTVEGTFLELGAAQLQELLHNVTGVLASGITTWTPRDTRAFLVEGDYVDALSFRAQKVNGDIVEFLLPHALVTWSLAAEDKSEGAISVRFVSRLDLTEATGGVELVLTTLTVSGSATVTEGATQAYTQQGYDQFVAPFDASGGTWTVTNGTGTATINASTGVLTGVTAGTVTVRYTRSGVFDDHSVTVVAVGAADVWLNMINNDLRGTAQMAFLYVAKDGETGGKPTEVTTVGSDVSQWADYLGLAPALVGAVGERPAWDLSTFALRFDGVAEWMATAASAQMSINGAKCVAIVIDDMVAGGDYAVAISEGSSAARWFALGATFGNYRVEATSSFTVALSGVGFSATRRMIYLMKDATTSISVEVADHAEVSNTASASASGNNILAIGTGRSGFPFVQCGISMVMGMNFVPTEAERDAVDAIVVTQLSVVLAA